MRQVLVLLILIELSVALPLTPTTIQQQSPTIPTIRMSSSLGSSRIGFVGCGTIASAICTGLATQNKVPIESIHVSRRSSSKSESLKEKFPNLVTVCDDNQEILNNSDTILLCVLPALATTVLDELEFDTSKHTLVSIVATTKINELVTHSKLPIDRISKMICLPSISRHEGICLHCCPTPNEYLTKLFDSIGGVVSTTKEDQMVVMMMSCNVMGPLYGFMKQNRNWLVGKGLSKQEASYLVIKQYSAMVADALDDAKTNENKLDELIEEQTPGGLNEQAIANLQKLGAFDAMDKTVDAIYSRVLGQSDGNI